MLYEVITVKTLEFRVLVRVNLRHDLHGRFFARIKDRQRFGPVFVGLRRKLFIVDFDAEQLQVVAVEHERDGGSIIALDP